MVIGQPADLNKLGQVSSASSMQQFHGGGAGHAEQQVLAQGCPNAKQGLHAGLPGQSLQDEGHVHKGHRQEQLPLVFTWYILCEPSMHAHVRVHLCTQRC